MESLAYIAAETWLRSKMQHTGCDGGGASDQIRRREYEAQARRDARGWETRR